MLCSDRINVGLELEYEGVSYKHVQKELNAINDKYWHSTYDGSLRPRDHNTELKFSGPLQGKLVLAAIENLKVLEKFGNRIRPSWRCGMHVHIDYTGTDYIYAHNTLILGAILEPILFAWAGPARVESKFCSPTRQLAYSFLRTSDLLAPRKYSAVNLASLHERNTVEFRYADTTTDRQMMRDFINVNMALRMAGESFNSGWEVLDSVLAEESLDTWIRLNLHPIAAKILTPFARKLATSTPWDEIAPAVAALAEHQDNMPAYVVGARYIKTGLRYEGGL